MYKLWMIGYDRATIRIIGRDSYTIALVGCCCLVLESDWTQCASLDAIVGLVCYLSLIAQTQPFHKILLYSNQYPTRYHNVWIIEMWSKRLNPLIFHRYHQSDNSVTTGSVYSTIVSFIVQNEL